MSAFPPFRRPDPDGDMSRLMDLMQHSETLVGLLHSFYTQLDTRRSQDFQAIADSIAQARAEISDLNPNGAFSNAGAELAAITQDTERATNAIMTAAETVMAMDAADPQMAGRITDEVMKMFEACAFQDITGQRISKIIRLLNQIEARVADLAAAVGMGEEVAVAELTAAELRAQNLLLNGPALDGPETNQADIDALFA
ncbi:protein phosphatase CheZ [Asticcacaulis sp.]|uniref:protein phosphatase CheZ n=1 Tax=Asticcacaulis sp. TaxID=1872648 RepID=UPI002C66E6D0|nr:protein phosphatase CheZ [Asticcacaulis sp.]HTM80307.1 protein phosphatase CheZ [Asticcacaulis sp.]